jgi:hypothetical protein
MLGILLLIKGKVIGGGRLIGSREGGVTKCSIVNGDPIGVR